MNWRDDELARERVFQRLVLWGVAIGLSLVVLGVAKMLGALP